MVQIFTQIVVSSLEQGGEKAQRLEQDLGISTYGSFLKEGIKMLSDGINFLQNGRYGKLVKDGKFIASFQATMLFCRIWSRLLEENRRILFPVQVVWVNGAPGAGKGTNTRNVMRALSISARPIIVSDLLKGNEFQEKIERGMLVDDEDVVYAVFKRMVENSHSGSVIIDGFPRTFIQAECIQLLQEQLKPDSIHMIAVVLLIDERTSIQRQIARGKEAIEYNAKIVDTGGEKKEVRKTDKDPELARRRYSEFCEKTHPALKLLRKLGDYHEINAKGSFDEVHDYIMRTFEKK
ncbi:MAG: nucleoside monophosphate kinase [Puniceicoccales bacterium]|jgi:adenylate kinase|nr:nucleoside monophosphate kinase [Puniceicoccales bacterium]